MIDHASIESLKSVVDIVDVVGNYVELKKAGANFKANCPFHGEKTPSFVVSPTKQIYHCFGCGVGGDAIKFLMEIEKLSYPEAIEKLADMYNFSLRYTKGKGEYGDLKRILEVLQGWYRANLDRFEHATAYLKSRGIAQSSIERFGIGYTPTSNEVIRFLEGSAIPKPKAIDAGILAQSEDRIYARLVERITFPIHSPSGSIVGFGGRTLGDHPAKYINSPQTKLFNKSRLLYGYHLAKELIYKKKQIIICEGYLDVILLHQGGFENAVATLGTALTSEHLPLLRKGEPEVILAYDGDKAGVNAALKAAKMLAAAGFEGGVVLFPQGLDPADMIAQGKAQSVADLLREANKFVPFVLETTVNAFDLHNPKEKERAFGHIKTFLDTLSPFFQEAYTPLAASLLSVPATMFRTKQNAKSLKAALEDTREDLTVLSVIKSLLHNRDLAETVLGLCEPSFFGAYEGLFEAALKGSSDTPHIRRLMLDDRIALLNKETLLETLRQMILKRYEQMLGDIARDTSIPFAKKSYLVRKLKSDLIPRLKRGEIIAFKPLR